MAKMCQNCGTIINDDTASNCVNCGAVLVSNGGVQQPNQNQYQNQYQAPQQVQYQQQFQQPMAPVQAKSKIAAGILAIFLGSLGVHNFYLGYTGKAVAQLLITVLTCGIGAIISGVWSLIEGIMILTGSISTDASGMPLSD
jgi:TM2 domain-containing membrane protein YozV